MFTLAICLAGTVAQGADFPVWTFVAENYLQILTTNILISYALATFVYIRSFSVKPGNTEHRELAAGGCTGNLLYDWFIGRELNPRVTLPFIGEIDIKEWMELRPGMLGWMMINFAFVAKQYRNFGYMTDSIVFVSIVQAIYILDGQFMEPAILTTIDITSDGFGFMLSFGDLVWVPFMYSMQTRYLAVHPRSLGWLGLTGVGVVLMTGFTIFRLTYLETKAGTRLITSGWWGIARHINYFGDWLQAWPYSLPTGLAGYTILTAGTGAEGAYKMFYIIYFAVLLIHRDGRDDEKCARKYGEDWQKYKKIVRWRIVPGVY